MKKYILQLLLFFVCVTAGTRECCAQDVTRSYADTAGYTPVPRPYTDKRNAIKGSLFFTRASLSYEHAVSKHLSLGLMATSHGGTFEGYIGSAYTRLYLQKFNTHAFFMEGKCMYGYFNPVAYSGYTEDYNLTYTYSGRHHADIRYIGGSFSAGYKLFITPAFFCEFLAGIRGGLATFGKDDLYFDRGGDGGLFYVERNVKDLFYGRGPGSAIDLLINFGIMF